MKKYLLIILISYSITITYSQEAETLFRQGNNLYLNEDYRGALDIYHQIEESGKINGELYYNMGNAYFKLKEIGQAILYYERARKFIPNDEDLKENLAIAELNTVDKITPIPKLFYERYWESIQNLFSINSWGYIFIFLYVVILFIIGIRFFIRNYRIDKLLKRLILVFLLLSMLTVLVAGSKIYESKSTVKAIVMSESVSVYSTPSIDSTTLFTLHEGTKVKILEENGEWRNIKLADGKVGWMKMSDLEII